MKESLVVSKDLAVKLKEAGLSQVNSMFHWYKITGEWRIAKTSSKYIRNDEYSAPLAVELMELLPKLTKVWNSRDDYWIAEFSLPLKYNNLNDRERLSFKAKLLPDALALMFLALNEMGMINLTNKESGE